LVLYFMAITPMIPINEAIPIKPKIDFWPIRILRLSIFYTDICNKAKCLQKISDTSLSVGR
jgi:hypothetical protein